MASGSFPVTTSNKYISGKVTWSSTTNTAGNYSDVTATLRLSRTNTGYKTWGDGTFTITIDGSSKSNSGRFEFTYNSNTLCVSHTKRVYHNDNGKKSIYISVSGSHARFNVNSIGKTVSLDTIPRYAKITSFSISDVRCTQFKINYSADRTVDGAQYRIGSGSWTTIPSNGIITGRSPNTSYDVRIRVRNAASGLWTESSTKTVRTLRLTTANAPDFKVGQDFTMSLSRENSNMYHDVTLQFWHDDQKWVDVATKTNQTTSVTFSLSEAQKNIIYNGTTGSNTSSARLKIVTRWGSGGQVQGTSYSPNGKLLIINANPSIDSVSYKDINTDVQNIIKNNQKILRNKSQLQVTAGTAKSQKGATLKSYKVTIGGNEYTASASGTEQSGRIINIGKVNQAANQTAVITVIDSRGNTASRSFTVQMLDYVAPQFIHVSADRLNNYEEPTTMNISARRAVVKPGSTDVNTVEMRYRIKQNPSGSYGSYIDLVAEKGSVSGIYQNVNVSQYMSDYPNDQSYTVEVGIKDKFTSWKTVLITLTEGIALLRFLQGRIEAGVPLVDQETGQPYIYFAESEEW